jgi:hypothetical protein
MRKRTGIRMRIGMKIRSMMGKRAGMRKRVIRKEGRDNKECLDVDKS